MAYLVERAVPLLTLTGAGGVGKTRLARAVADDASRHYADGIVWIDLSPLTDPSLIPQTTAQVLSLPESADRSMTDLLVHALQARQSLLIFDNCEHLLVSVASLVATLLSHCTALQVLATSRVPVGLSGEQLVRVAPLDLPAPQMLGRMTDLLAIEESAAVQLFVARAQAVEPAFALTPGNAATISEICQRLDGLPLALELAAARIRHLAPAQLLDRLSPLMPLLADGPRDQPQRLRTMRDAVAWSYDLLPPSDQEIFCCLAVFVGGFTLEAVADVITRRNASHREEEDVLASVGRLLDQSLLYRTEVEATRFGMLETIREFASDELRAHGGDATTREAHAAYYLALAERTDPELPLAHHVVPPNLRLDSDLDNVRAALTWLTAQGQWHDALRLAASASWTWKLHGRYQESMTWLQQALAMSDDAPPRARLHAMQRLTTVAADIGHYAFADALARENLALAHTHHDDLGIGRALLNLGVQAGRQGDRVRDGDWQQQALQAFRAAENPYAIVHSLTNLADWAYSERDYPQSQIWGAEALALARSLQHPFFIIAGLSVEAQLALEFRQGAKAVTLYQEMAALALSSNDDGSVADVVSGFAGVALLHKNPDLATRWLAAVQASLAQLGTTFINNHEQFTRVLAASRAMLPGERFAATWGAGWEIPLRQALSEAVEQATTWQVSYGTLSAPSPATAVGLSPRELDVLRLLVAGRSDPEIAEILCIGRRTAQSHVSSILTKLQVSNRTEAAARAVRDQLI